MSAGGGGSDFSVGAELSLTVPGRELSAVRSQIENELSDIPIGVDASVGGGRGQQPRDPSTGRFRSQRGAEQRLLEQIELAEERNELLDDIKDAVEGGGGGGLGLGGAAIAGRAGGASGGVLGGIGAGAALRGGLRFAGPLGVAAGGISIFDRLDEELGLTPVHSEREPLIDRVDFDDIQLQTPEDFPPELQLPEDFPPSLMLPQTDFPPRLELPPGFPPEIGVPQGFPPELQIPQAPRWAEELIDIFGGPGGLETTVNTEIDNRTDFSIDVAGGIQNLIDDAVNDVESELDRQGQQVEQLRRQLERALGL